MSYAFRYPEPQLTFPDPDAAETAAVRGVDDPVDNQVPPELQFLIARFDRVAANQARSRRYLRRSNTFAAGFRRHQRRGALS